MVRGGENLRILVVGSSNFDLVAKADRLRLEEEYPEALDMVEGRVPSATVTSEDVAAVVATWTGVPVKTLYTEEAAKLLQFQQAYQASAKMIATAQTVFSALLASMGP